MTIEDDVVTKAKTDIEKGFDQAQMQVHLFLVLFLVQYIISARTLRNNHIHVLYKVPIRRRTVSKSILSNKILGPPNRASLATITVYKRL